MWGFFGLLFEGGLVLGQTGGDVLLLSYLNIIVSNIILHKGRQYRNRYMHMEYHSANENRMTLISDFIMASISRLLS